MRIISSLWRPICFCSPGFSAVLVTVTLDYHSLLTPVCCGVQKKEMKGTPYRRAGSGFPFMESGSDVSPGCVPAMHLIFRGSTSSSTHAAS